jgi:hypothetical protein
MKILDNQNYLPFGSCIYCGDTEDLRKEHILPFGLRGSAILPKSTCRECAKITGQVEQKVLRGPMRDLRIYRKLKSRTKHREAPERHSLKIIKNEAEEPVELPINEFPILLHFPIFKPPAYLNQGSYEKGIIVSGVATISFGPRPEEVARALGAKSISITQDQEPVAFARMVAKIAYSCAAAEGKLDLLRGASPVVPAILGKTDDIGRWVGTITDPIQKYNGLLHRILIHEDHYKHILIGEVHLFSNSETPKYGVILGEI